MIGSCNLDCTSAQVSNPSQQYEAAHSAIEAATAALSDPRLRWRKPFGEANRMGAPGAKEEPGAWMDVQQGGVITHHEATALAACFERSIHELRCVKEATAKGIFVMLSRIIKLHKRGWTIKSRPRERCLAIGAGRVMI